MTIGPRFAHASEAELARIFDYYQVRWEYEPRTFAILWNLDGQVVESFAPDFYLPELDLFVELTTLKQGLVRKKNRKLRRLKELYPWLRIRLFYAKDFKALMLKYGRIDVAASFIGLEGQTNVGVNLRGPDRGGPPVPVTAPRPVALPAGASERLDGTVDVVAESSKAPDGAPERPSVPSGDHGPGVAPAVRLRRSRRREGRTRRPGRVG